MSDQMSKIKVPEWMPKLILILWCHLHDNSSRTIWRLFWWKAYEHAFTKFLFMVVRTVMQLLLWGRVIVVVWMDRSLLPPYAKTRNGKDCSNHICQYSIFLLLLEIPAQWSILKVSHYWMLFLIAVCDQSYFFLPVWMSSRYIFHRHFREGHNVTIRSGKFMTIASSKLFLFSLKCEWGAVFGTLALPKSFLTGIYTRSSEGHFLFAWSR